MFGIGMPEVAVIVVVALLVLGPKRLPEVARALGKGLAEFRRVTGEVNKELQTARDLIESEARDHETQRRARVRAEQAAAKAASVAAATSAEPVASDAAPPAAAVPHQNPDAPGPETGSPPSDTSDTAEPMRDAPAKA
jgi:Tat protein translocase TatB subunit